MMRKCIKEHGKIIEITGFRNVKIDDPEEWVKKAQKDKHNDVAFQFFNADLVATWEHLYFAALNALTAFDTERNISRDVVMEMMLYASAQRQIRRAIDFIGVKHGVGNIAVVIIGRDETQVEAALSAVKKRFGKEPDESVLEMSANKIKCIREAFEISDDEIRTVLGKSGLERAVVNLVIERVALLSTQL